MLWALKARPLDSSSGAGQLQVLLDVGVPVVQRVGGQVAHHLDVADHRTDTGAGDQMLPRPMTGLGDEEMGRWFPPSRGHVGGVW